MAAWQVQFLPAPLKGKTMTPERREQLMDQLDAAHEELADLEWDKDNAEDDDEMNHIALEITQLMGRVRKIKSEFPEVRN